MLPWEQIVCGIENTVGVRKSLLPEQHHQPHSSYLAGAAACPNPRAVLLPLLRLHLTSTVEETRLHSLSLRMSKLTSAYSTNEPWDGDWKCIGIPSFSLKRLLLQILNPLCSSCLNFLLFCIVLSNCSQSSSSSIANSADRVLTVPLSLPHITKETLPSSQKSINPFWFGFRQGNHAYFDNLLIYHFLKWHLGLCVDVSY